MNQALSIEKPEPLLSKRRLAWASVAAVAGCAAACSLPLLLAAAGGGVVATAVAGVLGAGAELVVGGVVFAGVLGFMALRARSNAAGACGTSCGREP